MSWGRGLGDEQRVVEFGGSSIISDPFSGGQGPILHPVRVILFLEGTLRGGGEEESWFPWIRRRYSRMQGQDSNFTYFFFSLYLFEYVHNFIAVVIYRFIGEYYNKIIYIIFF